MHDNDNRRTTIRFDWSWVLKLPYDGMRVPDGVQHEVLEDVCEPYFKQMQSALARKDTDSAEQVMRRQHAIVKQYVDHGFTRLEPIQKGLEETFHNLFRCWRRAMIKKILICPDADVPQLMAKLERLTDDATEFHCDRAAVELALHTPGMDMFADLRGTKILG